ncbi:MAG: nuclear transport factor 2 family protein [Selenomonadaceae bacterium]|nr:nuclear transport factor 2 family protein [Selenomonadaceae bacterium]
MGKTTQQYKAIEKVIEDYVTGTNGDVELLKEKVFLPTALINGSPIAELYEIVKTRGETHSTGRIDWADIQNGVASLRVLIEDWHGINFVEFFHLVLTREGWRISSKSGVEYVEVPYYGRTGTED